ncbi:MAG: TIM barrel protein [Candidatus Bathyarchaeia archaeon]
MKETIIAASTHNIKKPYANWLRDIHSLGFRYIDVEFFKIVDEPYTIGDSISRLKSIESDAVQELKNWVESSMLRVVSFEAGALFVDDDKRLRKSIARIREVISAALSFKCSMVTVTPSSFKEVVSREDIVKGCRVLIDECESYNVKLVLENGEVGSIKILRKPEDISYVIERVDSPILGVCVDVAAAATIDFNIVSYVSRFIDHIDIIHINDVTRDLKFKNLIVGLGDLKFDPFVRLVKKYGIPMVIEIYSGYGPVDLYLCKRQIEKIIRQVDY